MQVIGKRYSSDWNESTKRNKKKISLTPRLITLRKYLHFKRLLQSLLDKNVGFPTNSQLNSFQRLCYVEL